MKVYADNAATMKMRPEALEDMNEALQENWGNPSSVYSVGREAKIAMESARYTIAQCIGAKTNEIFFTSGGSEADTQAILSAAAIGAQTERTHVIVSAIEHQAVLKTAAQLEAMGFEVTYVQPDRDGYIDPAKIHENIRENTILVSVMAANNEIGTVQNIRQIGALCQIANVLFHTAAVQAVGHMPIDVSQLNVDLLTMSAHKFGGPKGIGAIYAKSGISLSPLILGGPQERGRRAGTENVPAMVGMATALETSCQNMEEENEKITAMRDKLIDGLLEIPGTVLNGPRDNRLPGNVSVCFKDAASESLLVLLDEAGICASAGSACEAGSLDPSHVLLAIGRSEKEAMSSLRLTLSADNTMDDVDYILETVRKSVEKIR